MTAAKFAPSWNAPSLVAPSPKNTIAHAGSPFSFFPHASPAACGTCVRDRHADRRDVVVGRVPPPRRMAAPPVQDRRGRHAAQEPDRRLAIAREDPVDVVERVHRAGLHRLVIPEDRVRPDAALTVVDERPLVVRPQQHHRAIEVEQLLLAEPVDLAILVDDAAQVRARRGRRWTSRGSVVVRLDVRPGKRPAVTTRGRGCGTSPRAPGRSPAGSPSSGRRSRGAPSGARSACVSSGAPSS